MKQTINVNVSGTFDDSGDILAGLEHVYNSCNSNDERPQNAYYNGCPRCVKIACAIADRAVLDCNVVLIKE